MSRVTLIGGSGMLGTALCRCMADAGHQVLVLDLVSPHRSVVERVAFRRCDIRHRCDLEGIEPCDRAYILAALLGKRCVEDPQDAWATNVSGTKNVIDALLGLHTLPTVCFMSSAAVYGAGRGEKPIAETDPTHPNGLYGASKLLGEKLLRAAGQAFGLHSWVLRPFTVYGHGPASAFKGHFVATWVERCLANQPLIVHGDGSQSIDLVHVSDLAEICCRADECGIASPEVPCLNVGSGVETRIKDVLDWFRDIRPSIHAEFHRDTVPLQLRNYADISLMKQLLGYEPKISPRDGMLDLLHAQLRGGV